MKKINRRKFIEQAGVSLGAASVGSSLLLPGCSASSTSNTEKAGQRYNLLFLMTDQQRWDTLSCYGHKVINTPNLDRLANEGVIFNRAYTASPLCVPDRGSILTGHSIWKTGLLSNKHTSTDRKLAEDAGIHGMRSFDDYLKEKGYFTAYFGKFHAHKPMLDNYDKLDIIHKLQRNPMDGYQKYLDKNMGEAEYAENEIPDPVVGRPYTPDPIDIYHKTVGADSVAYQKEYDYWMDKPSFLCFGKSSIPAEHSLTAFTAGQTLECLDELPEKPFSITCSFIAPHPPLLVSEPYYGMYAPELFDLPNNQVHDMSDSPYIKSDKRNPVFESEKIRFMMSDYYGQVKEVDDWVGNILKKLDDMEMTDNTMIVFTSDHGEMLGSHGMTGKGNFYEEACRIPLMIRFPKKIEGGKQVDIPVTQLDLFATILDYLEVEEQANDGLSLRRYIEDKSGVKDYCVAEWDSNIFPNYMVVQGQWKLLLRNRPKSEAIEALYNLEEDPGETVNLLSAKNTSPEYLNKRKSLKALAVDSVHEWQPKRAERLEKVG